MECSQIRAALSARMDSEPYALDDDVIDSHLSGCADCGQWYSAASSLLRNLRMSPVRAEGPADPPDDFAENLVASMDPQLSTDPQWSQSWLRTSLTYPRLIMFALALGYIVWAILLLRGSVSLDLAPGSAGVAGASEDAEGPGGAVANALDPAVAQVFIDGATVRFAVAFALIWCVFKPRSAPALLPLFIGLWGFSVGFATRDLVLGLASVGEVAGLAMYLSTLLILVWTWYLLYGSPLAVTGTLRSMSAKPVTTTLGEQQSIAKKYETFDDLDS